MESRIRQRKGSDPLARLKGMEVLRMRDIVGILGHSPEEAEEFRKRVLDLRKEIGKDMEKRAVDIQRRMAQIDWDKLDVEKMRKIFKGERADS